MNLYGYADGDPINFSDPFGHAAVAVCLTPVGLGACVRAAQVAFSIVRSAAVLAGAMYADHKTALDRVNTDIGIASAHLAEAASGPPNGDDDPNWVKDKLDDARKHINNAKKHVKDAIRGSRSRRDAQRQIDEAERAYQEMVQNLPPQ